MIHNYLVSIIVWSFAIYGLLSFVKETWADFFVCMIKIIKLFTNKRENQYTVKGSMKR